MTDIEKFKLIFPNCEYEKFRNEILAYNKEDTLIATLFYGRESIDEYYQGRTVESGELNPGDRTNVKVTPEQYIMTEFGSYEEALKAI